MAKSKKTTMSDDDLFAEIAMETGGDVLADLDSVRFFIDTGSLASNFVCCGKFIGGGIPSGRITEIFGPSSSGKSYLGSNILHGCQQAGGWPVILDCENATNGEFMAKTSHLNLKRVIRQTPETLEKAFHKIHTVTKKIREREVAMNRERKPIVFVYDSITVSPCERELKETDLPEDYKPSDWKKIVGRQEQPGERAKICSREMRKLQSMLEEMDVAVVILSQTRMQIGVMYGNPEIHGSPGKALEFYASLRLRTQAKKKIEHAKFETYAGVNMQVKNVKNRTFRPFVVAEDVKLFFDSGVDPLSGILSCLIESERVKMASAGNYVVMPDYCLGGSEYKFKASKVANTIPEQVVLDNPKLLDVETSQEVQDYLDHFRSGMAASASSDYTEKEVAYDRDGNPLDSESDAYDTDDEE